MGSTGSRYDRPSPGYPDEGRVARIVAAGVISSLTAGLTLGLSEVIGAAISGGSLLQPIQVAASLLLRERAFADAYLPLAIPLGVSVHFSMALLYGYAFGVANSNARFSTLVSPAREILLGAVYGALLCLLNFVVIGPYLYPWLSGTSLLLQLAAHVIAFGIPLAGLFSLAERHTFHRSGLL
jgi:hypothetical protein